MCGVNNLTDGLSSSMFHHKYIYENVREQKIRIILEIYCISLRGSLTLNKIDRMITHQSRIIQQQKKERYIHLNSNLLGNKHL